MNKMATEENGLELTVGQKIGLFGFSGPVVYAGTEERGGIEYSKFYDRLVGDEDTVAITLLPSLEIYKARQGGKEFIFLGTKQDSELVEGLGYFLHPGESGYDEANKLLVCEGM